jgi:hypothetical protein
MRNHARASGDPKAGIFVVDTRHVYGGARAALPFLKGVAPG